MIALAAFVAVIIIGMALTAPNKSKTMDGYWWTQLVTIALAVFALVLLLSACGDPPPSEGFVREKKYEPAHWEGGYRTEYQMRYGCRTKTDYYNGEYRTRQECGYENEPVQVWDPQHTWVGDRWRLKLEDCQVNDKGERKCRTGWVTVDETTYHDFRIGRHYPDNALR